MKRMVMVLMLGLLASTVVAQTATTLAYVERDPADSTVVWYDAYSGSRGISDAVDLDGDGLMEIYAVHYGHGGGIIGMEYTGEGELEIFWHSDTSSTTYNTGTRFVQTGDLDNDGLEEVIFFRGRYTDDPNGGLYVYEATGVDNEFADPVFFSWNAIGEAFNWNGVGKMGDNRVEQFVVDDVDQDGIDEIIVPINGASWIVDYVDTTATDTIEYGHSGDFIGVISASGDLQSGFGGLVGEYSVSPRDVDMGTAAPGDPMFGWDNRLGGGSPTSVAVSDIDGDGKKEIYANIWNGFNSFFIEATDADTYSLGDTTFVKAGPGDGVCLLQPTAADLDGDGKDEVYATHYSSGWLFKIFDADGDATNLTEDEVVMVNDTSGAGDGFYSIFGAVGADVDGDGRDELFIGGSYDTGDLINWNGSNFTFYKSDTLESMPGAFIAKYGKGDINNDGRVELMAAYQGVPDSLEMIEGTDTMMVANPHNWFVRVIHFGESVAVKDMPVITPEDYKLHAAYPNPFNPVTTIGFTLPVYKEISLVIYNELGQEVNRLIDGQTFQRGTYSVQWDGTNTFGQKVSSGVYFYTLKYGNFSKTHKVTLLQ